MSALAAAAGGYGAAPLAPHLPGLWKALRGELLAAASPGAHARLFSSNPARARVCVSSGTGMGFFFTHSCFLVKNRIVCKAAEDLGSSRGPGNNLKLYGTKQNVAVQCISMRLLLLVGTRGRAAWHRCNGKGFFLGSSVTLGFKDLGFFRV
jgi:hypothetical protein